MSPGRRDLPLANRLRIGLTGGIASGKSTVARRFIELGVPVIDADEVARAVVEPGQPGLAQVVQRFGADMLTTDGRLDRRALRNQIFSDPASRKALEAILHPRIQAEMERRAAVAQGPYLIMAIPLLVESNGSPKGGQKAFDRILVVDVDEAVQRQRLMARDSSSLEQAQAILAAQASRAQRLQVADDVLSNGGSLSALQEAVDALHQRYLRLAATAQGPSNSI